MQSRCAQGGAVEATYSGRELKNSVSEDKWD